MADYIPGKEADKRDWYGNLKPKQLTMGQHWG